MSRLGNIGNHVPQVAGTALIILGLSMLIWLAVGEFKTPKKIDRAVTPAESTKSSEILAFPLGKFSEAIRQSSSDTQRAYRFASNSENHELMKTISCYCGCPFTFGHDNLLDCYIKKFLPDNKVVYEEHAIDCQLCLEEAWETENLLGQGKTAHEIKTLIDQKYGI